MILSAGLLAFQRILVFPYLLLVSPAHRPQLRLSQIFLPSYLAPVLPISAHISRLLVPYPPVLRPDSAFPYSLRGLSLSLHSHSIPGVRHLQPILPSFLHPPSPSSSSSHLGSIDATSVQSAARSPRRHRLAILCLALLGVTMYPMLMAGVSCTQSSRFYLSSRVCRVPNTLRFLSSDSP